MLFTKIFFEEQWIDVPKEEEKFLIITGNLDKLTFARTAFQYSGYHYDANMQKLDINGDILVNEDDIAINAEIFNAHYALDDIYVLWKGIDFYYEKADEVLVLQYHVSFEPK